MKQSIKIIIISVIFGGFSGVFIDRFFFPYLYSFDAFKKYEFLKGTVETATIINKKEEIIVKEEEHIFDILSKVSSAVVNIVGEDGKTLGSGVTITSDGLILSLNEVIFGDKSDTPKSFSVVFSNNDKIKPESVGKSGNFAVIKVKKDNLSVVNIVGNGNDIRPGEEIIILGRGTADEKDIVSRGVINYFNSKNRVFYSDAKNYPALISAGVFNTNGEMVGLSVSKEENILGLLAPSISEIIKSTGSSS